MKLLDLLKNVKYKTCPYCKKQIRKNAVRCKWCGRHELINKSKVD